jgi:recombination protein RecA
MGQVDDFTSDLIKALNREMKDKVAYNLTTDESPTHVKRWIPTGSRLLDYIVSNVRGGGLPEGRIVEIFGDPGLGKSHIGAQICREAQNMGGMAVYIDTENATSPENLALLGVDIARHFVYVSEHCTENVLTIAEKTMIKARAMQKDVPVVIIWDSVAATSPKAELLGEYDANSIGLQARTISKGMRKITGEIGNNNVLFVALNQTRTKIGVMYGDPTTTSGGKAIPFHSSVRIQLFGGNQLKDKYGDVIGIQVKAKTIKDKVAPPFRKVEFEIHFGHGIKEHKQIFELLRKHGPDQIGDNIIMVGNFSGDSWRKLFVIPVDRIPLDSFELDKKTDTRKWPTKPIFKNLDIENLATVTKSFYLDDFDKLLEDPECGKYFDDLLERVMVRVMQGRNTSIEDYDINEESYVEMSALADEMGLSGDIEP